LAREHHGRGGRKRGEEAEHVGAPGGVQRRGRLVEEDDLRFGDEAGGDVEAGRHPPGEPAHPATGRLGETHPVEDPLQLLTGPAASEQAKGDLDDLERAQPRFELGDVGAVRDRLVRNAEVNLPSARAT
jgi:hypothetical protein